VRVTFFLPGEGDLERLRGVDPDSDAHEFVTGERVWILQTYLRLAAAGHPVELADRPRESGIVVYHAKQVEQLLRHWWGWADCVFVGARADHSESHLADFEVLQNRVWEDGRRRFFVPMWPQPALVPRDPARGERVERVAFKGFRASLHPDFAAPRLADALRERGIEFVCDAVDYRGPATDTRGVRWGDYREIDVVLAMRRPDADGHTGKPASKLYNAWRAGVPALFGPEPAYRELFLDALDYIEVASVDQAVAAIDRLREQPALYRAMVDHGRVRAAAFSPEAIRETWVDLLWNRIPALLPERGWQSIPFWLRPAARKASRLLEGRPVR
jgi:hypothetical protein